MLNKFQDKLKRLNQLKVELCSIGTKQNFENVQQCSMFHEFSRSKIECYIVFCIVLWSWLECFFKKYFPFLLFYAGEIKFMRSQKSKAQLVFGGYLYSKKITYLNGNTSWRCADFIKHKCFASCITKNNRLVRRRMEHNHSPPSRIANKKFYLTVESIPID